MADGAGGVQMKDPKFVSNRFKAMQIVNAAGIVYGVEPRGLRSDARGENAMRARQVAAYLIREDIKVSFPWIGRFLNRDHSTVIHARKRIGEAVAGNVVFKEKVESIRRLYPTLSGSTTLPIPRSRTSSLKVFAILASLLDVPPEEILSKKRKRSLVIKRQMMTYLIREIAERSSSELARLLGQHHTTVLHSCVVIKNAMEGDASFREAVKNVRELCLQDIGVNCFH